MTHPGYTYTIQSMDTLSENTWIDIIQKQSDWRWHTDESHY